jgi:hypothetical protein
MAPTSGQERHEGTAIAAVNTQKTQAKAEAAVTCVGFDICYLDGVSSLDQP